MLRYECHYEENKTKSIKFLHKPIFLPGHLYASVTDYHGLDLKGLEEMS